MRRTLSTVSIAHQETEGPSLKETLGWLKEKLPLGTTYYEYYADKLVWSVNIQSTVWSLDSCAGVFGFVMTFNKMLVSHQEPPSMATTRYAVRLGELNSASVVHEENALTEGANFIKGDRWFYALYLDANMKEI